jgi:hypothetical protein
VKPFYLSSQTILPFKRNVYRYLEAAFALTAEDLYKKVEPEKANKTRFAGTEVEDMKAGKGSKKAPAVKAAPAPAKASPSKAAAPSKAAPAPAAKAAPVGLYKLNPVDPQLESAWIQPLSLPLDPS